MANAELDRLGKAARRQLNLETDSFIIANDSISPYQTKRQGYIRVQELKGQAQLPAIEVRMFANVVVDAGRPVRLGYRDGERGVVWVDFDAEVARGENPAIHNAADKNASGFSNPSMLPIMKVVPTNPPSLMLMVLPIWRELPTGLELYMPDALVDLTTEVGAITAGNHRLAGLFLKADGTVEKVIGTEKNALDPMAAADVQEVYNARTPGAWPISVYEIESGMTDIDDSREFLDARQFVNPPPVMYSVASTSNPPTLAELNSTFGTPAAVGVIEIILNIGGLDTNIYRVISTGSAWAYSGYVVAT